MERDGSNTGQRRLVSVISGLSWSLILVGNVACEENQQVVIPVTPSHQLPMSTLVGTTKTLTAAAIAPPNRPLVPPPVKSGGNYSCLSGTGPRSPSQPVLNSCRSRPSCPARSSNPTTQATREVAITNVPCPEFTENKGPPKKILVPRCPR